MNTIEFVTLDVDDPAAADAFYASAFGLGDRVRVRASDAETTGFRGFTLSLICSQPATVRALVDSAIGAGATIVKLAEKSLWGFGGVVQAPDGTIWQIATSNKKDTGPATKDVDDIVILLAADDVGASKSFYVERGLTVGKSFGKYIEFDMPSSPIKLGLYSRKALAKAAGVSPEGSGSHRISLGGGAEPFTDPDGFDWEPASG
ncbi:MAG: glyoxalase [Cryobacterium sp.]|nr:glyoxalase [Cryobacterium sp.]